MRVKKKRKFRRGGGVFTNPSGMEIPSGWGVTMKKPSMGEVWIFSGTTQCDPHCSFINLLPAIIGLQCEQRTNSC